MCEAKYLFEWFNGVYKPFNSILEYDEYCRKHPTHTGVLYTKDGYIVNIDWRRRQEMNAHL